jgi:hypothetical protein
MGRKKTMRKKFKYLGVLLLFCCVANNALRAQKLTLIDSIVISIARYDRVVLDTLPYFKSYDWRAQHYRYELLKETTDVPTLMALTDHPNRTVSFYAAMILLDKAKDSIPGVFSKFLSREPYVIYTILDQNAQYHLYHEYMMGLNPEIPNEKRLRFELDSILLFNEPVDVAMLPFFYWLRQTFPEGFNKQIEKYAFGQCDIGAMRYLKWNYADQYRERIAEAMVKCFEEHELTYFGTSVGYNLTEDLLKLRKPEITKAVVDKLKRETDFWKSRDQRIGTFHYDLPSKSTEKEFVSLMKKYGIYKSVVKDK